MTPTPEIITSVATIGIAVGSGVYALTRDTIVRITRDNLKDALSDRDEWKHKQEQSRQELHVERSNHQSAVVELERLRIETNFGPMERKFDHFIEQQTQVNASLSDSIKVLSENLKVFTRVLERLVPPMTEAERIEQEERI